MPRPHFWNHVVSWLKGTLRQGRQKRPFAKVEVERYEARRLLASDLAVDTGQPAALIGPISEPTVSFEYYSANSEPVAGEGDGSATTSSSGDGGGGTGSASGSGSGIGSDSGSGSGGGSGSGSGGGGGSSSGTTPIIEDFTATLDDGVLRVSGRVTDDEDPSGWTIVLGDMLAGYTIQVSDDDTFVFVIAWSDHGTVSANVTDNTNLTSEDVYQIV